MSETGCFRKVNQSGGTSYPAPSGGWAVEISLDLDAVSAACPLCNGHKSDKIEAADPQTRKRMPLFNPRTQRWAEHFVWTADGLSIVGTTPTPLLTTHTPVIDMVRARGL